ncbi:Metallo-peptidase family M12-domain-containing protein, partial [Halteromyces radiatus]|uniref:Metallo-peptidase family M12-domain-containing protein n=1 Tax=Halteromyces radiatus TaxID=101107 RepID=UPI00221EAB79
LQHDDNFVLQFEVYDQSFILQLTPNADLFHPVATETILHPDGTETIQAITPEQFRIFKGHVIPFDQPIDKIHSPNIDHWARITIRHDIQHDYPYPLFEGAFSYQGDIYHIKTNNNYHLYKRNDDPYLPEHWPMVIYRDSDIHDDDSPSSSSLSPIMLSSNIPFDNYLSQTSSSLSSRKLHGNHSRHGNWSSYFYNDVIQGCPNSRKIAFMGAAADCSYVKSYGGIRLAKIQMVTDWNVASAVYERTFNVSLGLIYMQMSTSQCPQQPSQQMNWNQDCSNYYTINNRLSDFSFWRGQRGDDQASLWHLMTKCATGVKVGIAWLSQLCEYQASQQIEDNGLYDWVSGTGVSSITREEWKVVAHEIGHGFGAIHDCAAQSCSCQNGCACCPLSPTKCSAGETYLMNPTSNVSTNDFSPCSITDICSSFPNIGYCLKSPGDINNSTFSMCGNGILEPGEQCDPGRTDSPCCFAKNCTLKAGAICDQCCLNCAIAPKDTVCRPAASECDTEEVCTGLTSQCPPDVYDADGTSCSNGTMQCASGVCTSRDEQCTARGLRLNITQQCPFQEDSCSISCADPLDSQNCLVLSGMFLDGTECGLAGFCRSGKCVGSGFSNTVRAWVEKNKNIAIPVFIFGGLFLL